MKTDQLIDLLARDPGPVPRGAVARRIGGPALAGVAVSALAALFVLGLVPMAVLGEAGWWLKLAYAVGLVAVGGWLTARLARPVQRLGGPRAALVAVLGAMAAIAGWQWFGTAPELRMAELLGHSWRTCPRNVVLLALPPMAAAFWALRGLAPTRPRAAGAAAGLLAGALGAAAYALSCSEVAPSFVAVWYTMGIAASTALGALLGPRLLRW